MLAKRKPKNRRSITEPRKGGLAERTVPQRPRIPFATLLRMFLLGSVAVVASVYAIWRYYTVPYQKMLVPKPAASEVEIEWEPGQPIPSSKP